MCDFQLNDNWGFGLQIDYQLYLYVYADFNKNLFFFISQTLTGWSVQLQCTNYNKVSSNYPKTSRSAYAIIFSMRNTVYVVGGDDIICDDQRKEKLYQTTSNSKKTIYCENNNLCAVAFAFMQWTCDPFIQKRSQQWGFKWNRPYNKKAKLLL